MLAIQRQRDKSQTCERVESADQDAQLVVGGREITTHGWHLAKGVWD